jgi:enoyl-[acyl-carrier protein] reductase III
MRRHAWGRIVTVSSLGSVRVYPSYAMVGVSKAALEALTRYLAAELASDGIIVNAVLPGVVDTEALGHFPFDPAAVMEVAVREAPAKRLTTPEDVGRVVAFLCTEGASMIVGQTIVVDGGFSLHA